MLLLLTGVLAAGLALTLYLVVERQGAAGLPLAALRAVAWGAVAALLLNPALRRPGGGAAAPTVLLDGSLSMGDSARWAEAVETGNRERAIGNRGGRILVFGEEPRPYVAGMRPTATTSRLLPALREAAARGGPVVIVTDGAIDDLTAIPTDLLRSARIVMLERSSGPDAGVAGFDLPPALRAGDTARVAVDVAVRGARPGDSLTIEVLERGRASARLRVALPAEGLVRRELSFVPAPPAGEREVRRFEVRLSGFAADGEPRDDRRASVAAVTRGAAVAALSDSPDWDFRALAAALAGTSGVPVEVLVHPAAGGQWRNARTLRPVSDADVRAEVRQATLVVAHGTDAGISGIVAQARGSVLRWPAVRAGLGDWYVAAPEFASPVGGALAGVPVESLPPLEALTDVPLDPVEWTGLVAQLDRRGRLRPVVQGAVRNGRRTAVVSASGFWRWSSRGGAAAEGYRAFVASLADWLLEERGGDPAQLLAARDSLARGLSEYLPRAPALRSQPGLASAALGEPVPLRHSAWVYFVALGALVIEWIARRRRGLR